jgi:archaeal chaperonin
MPDTSPNPPGAPEVDERHAALRSNAAAVRTVAAAVEGTLGPKGLDCMLVDRFGDVTITNDGSTILGKIDVKHPASRLLIHGARAQDDKVGDGTTTATVLAASLIEEGVAHALRGVPPTKVVEGMRAGVAAAIAALEAAAAAVSSLDDPRLGAAARIAARGGDELARLAVEAARRVPEEKLLHDPAFRLGKRVVAKEGAESRVFDGVIVEKERMNRQMPTEVEDAVVLVVADALEPEKVDDEALATEAGFRRATKLREEFGEEIRRLVGLGVRCVVAERRVDEVAEEQLTEAGVLVLRRVTRRDLAEIADHTGARPLMRAGLRRDAAEIAPALGRAARVAEDERLGCVMFEGGAGKPTATLLVGAATAEVRDERARIATDAAAAVQACARGGVLPGGGAAEIGCLPAIAAVRERTPGMAAYGVDTVLAALKRPLAQIVANAGFNPLEKVEEAVAQQAATGNRSLGIDCDTGAVTDLLAAGVVDPAPVKIAAIRTAAEIAEAILRISVVIRKRDEEPPSAPQTA